jgi:type IV pilus biogenesis protein PilP
MKPNFALDLSHEGINLLHRSKGGWTLVGSVGLDDPDIGARLSEMRRSAAMLESGGFTTKLIIPDSQILYTTVAASGPDDIAREVQIRAGLDGLTPYPVGELVFDWRAQGDEARVAVLARETMDEAEAFAADHQFNPVSFVGRPKRGEFSGEPFFGKTRAAARLLPPGERIEPDASPVPANPKAKELPVESRIDLPPTPEVTPEPEPAPPPVRAPEPEAYDDPFAELDRLASELSGDVSADIADKGGEAPEPKSPPRPKRKPERLSPVSPPALAPFPPTPDEEGDAPMPTPRPFMPQRERSGKAAKPAAKPEPKSAVIPPAPPPVTPSIGELDKLDPPDAPAQEQSTAPDAPKVETWPISFASTRTPHPGSDTTQPEGASADTPASTPKAPPPLRDPGVPPLSHDRIRAEMSDALSKPLPRPGDPDQPEKASAKRSGFVSTLGKRATAAIGSTANALSARAAARRDAKAAVKPAPVEKPQTPAAKPETRRSRGGFGFKRTQDPAQDQRSREAEALTVFGARRSQTEPSRPRYLGLILTLVLLLVMAAVAIWSTFLVDNGEVSLFNPGPDVAAENTTPEPDASPDEADTTAAPSTAEVLSPEAAEARYAATGIWQRGPEAPSTPETTRLDRLDIADLAPLSPNREPTALPDDRTNGEREALLANPVPPPPPGTAFDLDENGLVVPTPEGALSPTGILVFSGSPVTTPPPPPEGLFPDANAAEPAAPDDAALEGTAAEETPAEEPAAALADEAAQPAIARIRPAARPDNLQLATAEIASPDSAAEPAAEDTTPMPDIAAIDAAVEEVVLASLVDATELAVSASRVPSRRPANFANIVEATRASASDGSQVIAAPATVTPAIPTSASVATRATTENALNLREINLIGIYGSSNARRALVRLKTGRYVKVVVGDSLDGGKVTSISASRLIYQKGSRAYALDVLPLG